MTHFCKLIIAFLFTAAIFSLTACEPEAPVTPTATRAPENPQDAGFILRRHLLTQFGPQNIFYNESNQVKMVVHDGRYTTKYERYYSNGKKYIKTKLYSFGQLIREEVYTLNANGRCIELTTKYFQFVGNVAKIDNYSFIYNASGKLIRLYNQALPKEQTKFTYDSSGNLYKVDYFKANGAALKTITYTYTNDYPAEKVEDLYLFNPELDNVDFHLRIFGTFSKHLIMKEQVENHDPSQVDTSVYFKYSLSSSDYPYLREERMPNGSFKTTYYKYKTVIVGLD